MKLKMINYLILLATSCAHSKPLLRIQDRELLIDPNGPNLIYPYYKTKCEHPRRLFFKKCKKVYVMIKHDLNDATMRNDLIKYGFTCSTKQRFRY